MDALGEVYVEMKVEWVSWRQPHPEENKHQPADEYVGTG